MEPEYSNTGMYSMHTVQQPADLNNSLLNQPLNLNSSPKLPASGAQPAQQQPYQQPAPKKGYVKRHPCPWEGCDRLFAGQHNVNQHIREAHTGERPYRCPECAALGHDKAFARPFSLNRHRRQRHNVDTRGKVIATGMQNMQGPDATAGDADVGQMFRGMLFGNNGAVPQPAPANMDGLQNGMVGVQSAENDFFGAFANEVNTSARRPANIGGAPYFDANATIDDFFNSSSDQMDMEPVNDKPNVMSCGYCDEFKSEDPNSILLHQHDAHFAPNTPLCDCTVCKMMFIGNESDAQAQVHAQQLAEGAFGVLTPPEDEMGGHMQMGGIPGAGDAMDFTMAGGDDFFGNGGGKIDPALLADF